MLQGFRCTRRLCLWLTLGVLVPASVPVSACIQPAPQVHVNKEQLQGQWQNLPTPVAVFRGVPFAAAPVGDLRWQSPKPPVAREGLQMSVDFAPACTQGPHLSEWYAGVARAFGGDPEQVGRPNGVSEDCLYLNIWSPDLKPDAGLPVMVWVHGGSNKSGWSYEPNYLGERLAARGAVVVTLAYRVGPLGFFAHPALGAGDAQTVANFGLLDIAAGLKWVRDHIAAFGGDPANITAMGESSGASNLLDLALGHPGGDPLFERLVIQSPALVLGARQTLAEEQQRGEALAAAILGGDGRVSAEALRQIPAARLASEARELFPGYTYKSIQDGSSFSRSLQSALNQGEGSGLSMLAGTNAHEWRMYLDAETSDEDVDRWLKQHAPGQVANARQLVAEASDARQALDRLSTAGDMRCPLYAMARGIEASGGHSFVYHFERQRPGPGGALLGVYHGTEIAYVFDQHEPWQSIDDTDRELTRVVMDYWLQFARNGKPYPVDAALSSGELLAWPRFRARPPMVLRLGDVLSVGDAPDWGLCRVLGFFSEPQRP